MLKRVQHDGGQRSDRPRPRHQARPATSADVPRQRRAQPRARRRPARARRAGCARRQREGARAAHRRGKLLPRDRVERLLDPGSPFLEIGQLAANGVYGDDSPRRGADRRHRPRLRPAGDDRLQRRDGEGRHLLPAHRQEASARAGDRAARTACPASTWSIRAARTCRTRPRSSPTAIISAASSSTRRNMSALGIPQIACVMGSCTAGGAYVPAMSDETVIVRNQGTIFLAGPPLVKAATGEVISAEELGGADTHGRKSGVVDHVAENDEHALTIVRDIVSTLAPPRTADSTCAIPARRSIRRRGPLRHRPPGRPRALRRPRGHRAAGRRQRVPRVQGALRRVAGLRLRAHLGPAGRDPRQQRRAVLRVRAEGRALHRTRLPAPHAPAVPPEHLAASWSAASTRRKASPSMAPSSSPPSPPRACPRSRPDRRQLRRGQLRHVRPRLFAPLPVHLAQQPHQRDGRRAGGERAGDGPPRRGRAGRRSRPRRSRPPSARSTRTRATRTTPPRGCGTTA